MATDNHTTAIATMPTSLGDFSSLADRFAKSTLIPADLRAKPEDVFVTLLAGHELGLAPMASLRAIHVVKGKPILSADAMVAIVLGRGACEYFVCVEETDAAVTYETKRVNSPRAIRATWTMKDAERAGLAGGDNWRKYPRAMMKARCKAGLARDVYPDVLAGCYEEGEAHEAGIVDPAQVAGAIDAPSVERIVPPKAAEPEVDPWTAFLADLATVPGAAQFAEAFGEPVATWTEEHVLKVCIDIIVEHENRKALNEALGTWSAIIDRHAKGSTRIAKLKDAVGVNYKARVASLRAAEQAAAGASS